MPNGVRVQVKIVEKVIRQHRLDDLPGWQLFKAGGEGHKQNMGKNTVNISALCVAA